MDDKFTMLPERCSCMTRSSCLMESSVPRTLVSERAGVGLRGDVGDVADLAVAAGVVHRDVQAAELPGDGADEAFDLVLVTDVGLDERGRLGPRHLAALGEGDGGRPADAGVCASDEDNGGAHGWAS